jgi:O-methyltransferase
VYLRERLYRQEFFFNAFKALRFNGIDGDTPSSEAPGAIRSRSHMTRRGDAGTVRTSGHSTRSGDCPLHGGQPTSIRSGKKGRSRPPSTSSAEQCAKNGISRNDYTAVPGFYEETLTAMSPTDEPTDIALAYIDCDLYTSTKAAQDFLRPRLKHGMIVAFDDYFCWSPSQISGERRALLEVDGEAGQWGWTPYIQFGWSGASFVIEEAAQGADDEAGAHKPLGYKLLTAAAALYVVLPFDVIPDFVPVVGHFDDAIVVALVLRAVKQNWLAAFLRLTGLRRASPEPQAA